ncbi:MAG: serine/threonine protein kinase, partial [Candidatus Latescibacterota bacterium]
MKKIDETYRIERALATGGTAALFKAVQVSLDRPVVVKRLHAHLAAEPGFAERFATEAKAAARLDHANIVRIIDFGRDDAGHYIVMEYVDGPSLKEVLAARPVLGDDLALLVAREICLGLDHAHRRGVVHRDIKPANVMIGRDGRVVITDFGLAKLHRPDAQQTLASTLLGTPLYMSPEQAAGEAIDGRSDLFSLGTICYEALTGAQPFFGDTYAAVIRKILNGVSAGPKRLRGDVRPATDAVVMKALELDPAKRFRDAAEMASAIEAALDPETIASSRASLRLLACGEDAVPHRVRRLPGKRRASSPARVTAIAAGAAALLVLAAVRTGVLGVLPQS